MTLIHPSFRFLHVPKTGGEWCTAVLQKHFGPQLIECNGNQKHANRYNAPGEGLPTIAFVRHPLTWYQSYWAYKQLPHVHWADYGPDEWGCDDFCKWVNLVLDHDPGHLSISYPRYTDEAAFVGRFESLSADLQKGILSITGEDISSAIATTPRVNMSREVAIYDDDTHARVLEVEALAIERYYSTN